MKSKVGLDYLILGNISTCCLHNVLLFSTDSKLKSATYLKQLTKQIYNRDGMCLLPGRT